VERTADGPVDVERAQLEAEVHALRERVRELEASEERVRGEAELRYRELFDSIDEGFCVIEMIFDDGDRPLDYRFLETNPAWEKHTGLRDAVGRTARELLPGLEEHWFRIYGEVARTGEPIRFEEGSEVMGRWFDVYAFRVQRESRTIALLFSDVSEQRRSDAAIHRSAEQLGALTKAAVEVQSAGDLREILRITTEHAREIIGAHQAVASLTSEPHGTQAVDAVSLSDRYARWRGYETLASPDGSGIYRLVATTGAPMRLTQEELEAHPAWRAFGERADEHPPLRGWLAAPLLASDGSSLGLIQLSDRYEGDFTAGDEALLVQLAHLASVAVENASLYRAELEARREAEHANRAKADFLAAMSHDLRTPLNAIGGYVDLLDLGVHGPVTDEQRGALARIAANQRHLLMLIHDILQFARVEAGQVQFELAPIQARELLRSVEPLVAPSATARRIAYSVEECDPELHLLGDGERVRQIVLNLVTNAVKYTQEGGRVLVACAGAGDRVRVTVRDNGPGIPADRHVAIFDPFVQVHRRLDSPQEGVGLGLAISRDLARAMGGELEVESEEGAGTTFTLSLPRVEGDGGGGVPAGG
jgi:signal transduction histidine kinase